MSHAPCPCPEDHALIALWLEAVRQPPRDFLVPMRRVWAWLGLMLGTGMALGFGLQQGLAWGLWWVRHWTGG